MKPTLLILALVLAAPLSAAQETTPAKAKHDHAKAVPTETAALTVDVADDAAAPDIVSTLDASGDFTILVQALRDTGLAEALAGSETFTLFAPTDAAFQKLPAGTLDGLGQEQLVDILRYHLLVGPVSSAEAAAQPTAPTVQGDAVTLAATGDALTVNGKTMWENVKDAPNWNQEVIRPWDHPLVPQGGIAVLRRGTGRGHFDHLDPKVIQEHGKFQLLRGGE